MIEIISTNPKIYHHVISSFCNKKLMIDAIISYRAMTRISYKEISKKTGISVQILQRIFTKKRAVKPCELQPILKALNIESKYNELKLTIDSLFFLTPVEIQALNIMIKSITSSRIK